MKKLQEILSKKQKIVLLRNELGSVLKANIDLVVHPMHNENSALISNPMKLSYFAVNRKITLLPVCLLLGGAALAQTMPSLETDLISTQQALANEQLTLAEETDTFLAGDISDDDWQAWSDQHAAEIQLQQERATQIGAESFNQPMRKIAAPPQVDTSSDVSAFLKSQTALANSFVLAHNQQTQNLPSPMLDSMAQTADGMAQLAQVQQDEKSSFQQQHVAELQDQQQQAQNLAVEASQMPIPVPPPLTLPSSMTPENVAISTLRDQLIRESIQLRNQWLSADPSVQKEMFDQWNQQNAGRFQQLQSMIQAQSQP